MEQMSHEKMCPIRSLGRGSEWAICVKDRCVAWKRNECAMMKTDIEMVGEQTGWETGQHYLKRYDPKSNGRLK